MMDEYPKQLSVMVTSRCNLRCKLCNLAEYHVDLDYAILEKMHHVYPMVEWFHPTGGEPFLYDLKKLFSLPFSNNCKVKIITNGTLINSENVVDVVETVDRLVVSVDGGTDDAYRTMRGYSLKKVLRGIERVQECKIKKGKQTPNVEFNFLLTKTTITTLPDLAAYAASNGIDRINTFYPSYKDSNLITTEKINKDEAKGAIAEAKKLIDIIEPEKRGGEDCRRPWNTCFVDVKGNVFLCCFGTSSLGNLYEMSFDECWFGPTANMIRETVNTKKEIRQCKMCPVR